MDVDVNRFFSVVVSDKKNTDVFDEALKIEELRIKVVKRLDWIEKNDTGLFWGKDKLLMDLFITLSERGDLSLPKDSAERLRWIALLCKEISEVEGYDYKNVIIPLDYLPDSLLNVYEDTYWRARRSEK